MLDRILDATVLPGYTNIGYRLRRHAWSDDELEPMDGRVALVTGATSGLGLATATGLARLGASVRMLARSADRAEHARAEVVGRTGNNDVEVVLCDLSDLGDIGRFATEFLVREPRLDVLVNNAGVLPAERTVTVDGLELTFATNVAGPFLMTKLLLPLLRSSAPSRIVHCHLRRHVHAAPARRRPADGARGRSTARPRTRAPSAPRWCSPSYGRSDSRARASSYTRCTRAGPTPRDTDVLADVPPAQPAAAAHARAGRRHDRLALGGRRAGAQHRRLLARPAPAPDAPGPMDARVGRRARGAVDGVRTTDERRPRSDLMARYTDSVDTPRSAASRLELLDTEWDPGVTRPAP